MFEKVAPHEIREANVLLLVLQIFNEFLNLRISETKRSIFLDEILNFVSRGYDWDSDIEEVSGKSADVKKRNID